MNTRELTAYNKGELGDVVLRVYGRGRYLLYMLLAFAGSALLFFTPNLTKYYSNLKSLYLVEWMVGGALALLGLWQLFLFARVLVLREKGFEVYSALGKKACLYDDCTFTLLRTNQPIFTMAQYNLSDVTGRTVVWDYTVHLPEPSKALLLSNRHFHRLEDRIQEFNVRQKEAGRTLIHCAEVKDRFIGKFPDAQD